MDAVRIPAAKEGLAPPKAPGALVWMQRNLFSSWWNTLLTLLTGALVIAALRGLLRWAIFSAVWETVTQYPLFYLVGQYPRDQLWRPGLLLGFTAIVVGIGWRKWPKVITRVAAALLIALPLLAVWLAGAGQLYTPNAIGLVACAALVGLGYLLGRSRRLRIRHVVFIAMGSFMLSLLVLFGIPGSTVLPVVETRFWGGLVVTFLLAISGMVISFPFGLLLALGRRSSLPFVRLTTISFIEIIRGVPLIAILFIFSMVVPLLLPMNVSLDRILRALSGIVIFSAVFMAENVRGGFAAVPPGQVEAGKALGLTGLQVTWLIVIPQALRAVIPPLISQFITLMKVTTLASGVSVLEFLAMGRAVAGMEARFVEHQLEMYVFIAAVFWILSSLISHAGAQLEHSLGVGER